MAQKINRPSADELNRWVVDIDKGYKDIVKFFEEVGGFIAKAGFVEGKASKDSVFKATINHFGGTSSDFGNPIPPRPFITDAFDPLAPEYAAEIEEAVNKFFTSRGKFGARQIERAMNQVAARVAGDIDASLLAWSDPPNAPYTVFRKGFNDPLVETGAMANDIDYEVTRYEGHSQLSRQLEALKAPASGGGGGRSSSGGGFGGVFAKAALNAARQLAKSPGYEGGGIRAAPERRPNVTSGVASQGTRRGADLSRFKF